MRILVVEDSPIERRMLESTITALGHECLTAADGEAAWAAITSAPPDVVLSDWRMPGLDGLELCRLVRGHERLGYIYFIFLSVLGHRTYALQGIEAGADDYLTKPLDREELRLRLIAADRVTALHRQIRQAERARGRLEGVRLATRTMQHELGNALSTTVGYCELIEASDGLPPDSRQEATRAHAGAIRAMELVDQMNRLTCLEETTWGPGLPSTLQLPHTARP